MSPTVRGYYSLPSESGTLVVCQGILLLFLDSLLRRQTGNLASDKRAAIPLRKQRGILPS